MHRGVLHDSKPLFHPVVDSDDQRFGFHYYGPLLSPSYLFDLSRVGVAAMAGV